MGGIVERYSGIKILGVHGGGYLPFYLDRLDHAATVRTDVAYKITGKPSDNVRSLYFDTVVHGAGLAQLIDLVGAAHVLLGTDFPYDMGDTEPVSRVNRVEGINPVDKANIIGLNAARLLGLAS